MCDCITREMAMSMPWANGQYDHEHANEHFICGLETYKEWLEYVPAADVRPVMRGHWIDMKPTNEETGLPISIKGPDFRCSNCGATEFPSNFCPNCGADMRGK